jgi:hypothetical protein
MVKCELDMLKQKCRQGHLIKWKEYIRGLDVGKLKDFSDVRN